MMCNHNHPSLSMKRREPEFFVQGGSTCRLDGQTATVHGVPTPLSRLLHQHVQRRVASDLVRLWHVLAGGEESERETSCSAVRYGRGHETLGVCLGVGVVGRVVRRTCRDGLRWRRARGRERRAASDDE